MSEWHQILCDSYEIRRLCDENGDSWRELVIPAKSGIDGYTDCYSNYGDSVRSVTKLRAYAKKHFGWCCITYRGRKFDICGGCRKGA